VFLPLFLLIIFFFILAVIFFSVRRSGFYRPAVFNKTPESLLLIAAGALCLTYVFYEPLKLFSRRITLLITGSLEEFSPPGRDYSEIYYTAAGKLAGAWYNPKKHTYQADIFSSSGVQEYALLPAAIKPSPFIDLDVDSQSVKTHISSENGFSSVRITSRGKTVTLGGKLSQTSFFSPSPAGGGVYISCQQNGRYSIALWSFDRSALLDEPGKGHFYNPFYWNEGQVLFYSGITRLDKQKDPLFKHALYMKTSAGLFTRVLSVTNRVSIQTIKIDGDSRGRFFMHIIPESTVMAVYDMNYFPFAASKNTAGYNGVSALEFSNFAALQSLAFNPVNPLEFFLLGRKIAEYENRIFRVNLDEEKKFEYSLSAGNWIFMVLGAVIGLILNIAGLRRLKKITGP